MAKKKEEVKKKVVKKKHAGGAPKKPFESWKGWRKDIYTLYMDGASDVEVKALIIIKAETTISNDLWTRWMKEEREFSETIKQGRLLSEAWWQKKGRTGLEQSNSQDSLKLNYTGWYMNMKNRFGWKDKQEVETITDQKVTVEYHEIKPSNG